MLVRRADLCSGGTEGCAIYPPWCRFADSSPPTSALLLSSARPCSKWPWCWYFPHGSRLRLLLTRPRPRENLDCSTLQSRRSSRRGPAYNKSPRCRHVGVGPRAAKSSQGLRGNQLVAFPPPLRSFHAVHALQHGREWDSCQGGLRRSRSLRGQRPARRLICALPPAGTGASSDLGVAFEKRASRRARGRWRRRQMFGPHPMLSLAPRPVRDVAPSRCHLGGELEGRKPSQLQQLDCLMAIDRVWALGLPGLFLERDSSSLPCSRMSWRDRSRDNRLRSVARSHS